MKKTQDELINLVEKLSFDDYVKSKILNAISHFDSEWVERIIKSEDLIYKSVFLIVEQYENQCMFSSYTQNDKNLSSSINMQFFTNVKGSDNSKTYLSINAFSNEENEDYNILEQIISNIKAKPYDPTPTHSF